MFMKLFLIILLGTTITTNLFTEEIIIKEINNLYKTAKELHISKQPPDHHFYNYWDFETNILTGWKSVNKTESDDSPVMELKLFYKNNTISSVIYNEFSLSGDWGKTTEYYFWRNGSIAFIFSSLETFHGSVIIERTLYFDRAKKEIKKIKTVKDLISKSIIKDNPDSYLDNPPEIVNTFKNLLSRLDFKNKLNKNK